MVIAALMPVMVHYYGPAAIGPVVLLALFVFLVSRLASATDITETSSAIIRGGASTVYISAALSHVVLLAATESGRWWLLFTLVLVWSNDTFAYYTGRRLGRTKLAPRISPGKTVEGAVGGIVGGVVAAYVFIHFTELSGSVLFIAAAALLLGALSILGDLLESVFKRGAGVKDSGSLIPGHGGLLDRIDSLLFVVPAMYYLLLLRGMLGAYTG